MTEAFAEGCLDGIDGDCMAQAALFRRPSRNWFATYGEDATARYAATLPERIRGGGFTTTQQHWSRKAPSQAVAGLSRNRTV